MKKDFAKVRRRLEFVFDIGLGPKVLAFVDFSGQGVSFGIPQQITIKDLDGEPVIDSYMRITVHTDGRVVTHLPVGVSRPIPWDGSNSTLATWNRPWSVKQELYWGAPYLPFIKNYLAKPKLARDDVRIIQLGFPSGVEETAIRFGIMRPRDACSVQIRRTLGLVDPTWVLTDAWPRVLVSIANVAGALSLTHVDRVGRDYR